MMFQEGVWSGTSRAQAAWTHAWTAENVRFLSIVLKKLNGNKLGGSRTPNLSKIV
jgi:hypothetical protein